MDDSSSSESRKFRLAFGPMFIWMFLCGVLPGVALTVFILAITHKSAALGRALPAAIAAGLVAQVLGTWMARRFFPVVLSEQGLSAHSFWGVRRFMCWQDIASTRSIRILNLLWLRLYSRDGKEVIWLAMFQSRPAEFRAELRKLAPPGHPLLNHWK